MGRDMKLSREEMVRGLMVGGLIGLFIAEAATFSAEVAGCQVECGAASGMAAAAVTQMMGGTIEQCIDAASMALQNITGLACDPVANRVEVPCLGKNVMGGSNAIASANMILAGYNAVIPLDETIAAIYEIGLSLPLELRCTFGGLGKTKTSVRMLENQK
ncbi:MAG: L-serine ammonia-lyase, iron-sulfur-dependent, subunit alpha [Ruminococcus sp.]|nr:L-serine ammonia-lyase, iron-sulfur-dependent, subunit alpha [Ruminococcus sp.]